VNGLNRQSTAPPVISRDRNASSRRAVMKITGISIPRHFSSPQSSGPVIPAIATSRIAHRVFATASDSRYSSADENARVVKPNSFSKSGRDSRTDSSSSTIETREPVFVMLHRGWPANSESRPPSWNSALSAGQTAQPLRKRAAPRKGARAYANVVFSRSEARFHTLQLPAIASIILWYSSAGRAAQPIPPGGPSRVFPDPGAAKTQMWLPARHFLWPKGGRGGPR
jgi:hypothetical protein